VEVFSEEVSVCKGNQYNAAVGWLLLYYLRYLDPANAGQLVSERAYDDWMPLTCTLGRRACRPTPALCAFWHKVLYDIGVVKDKEPFSKLVHQARFWAWHTAGMRLWSRGTGDSRIDGDDARVVKSEDGLLRLSDTGEIVEPRWVLEVMLRCVMASQCIRIWGTSRSVAEKMSKSRGMS